MKFQKIIACILLLVALAGFADATYLTLEHYKGVVPPCFVADGCETVLTSSWSVVAGVPVSLLGAIYYAAIALLVLGFLVSRKEKLLTLASWATFIGLFASLWFVSLQLFIIKNICFYCMVSAATSVILFITGSVYIFKRPKNQVRNENPSLLA